MPALIDDPSLGRHASLDLRARTAALLRQLVWHWVLIVGVSLAAGLAFAAIGEDVFEHQTGSVDDAVRDWTLARRTPGAYAAFLWITRAGSPPAMALFVLLVALWLWHRRGRAVASVVVLAPAVATAAFTLVKGVVQRRRPAGALLLHELAFSFPSGHSATAAAVMATLMYVLTRERLVPWGVALALAVVVPLLIGVSRVVLDVHYATDVVGGWCLGLAIAAGSVAVYERLRGEAARHRAAATALAGGAR